MSLSLAAAPLPSSSFSGLNITHVPAPYREFFGSAAFFSLGDIFPRGRRPLSGGGRGGDVWEGVRRPRGCRAAPGRAGRKVEGRNYEMRLVIVFFSSLFSVLDFPTSTLVLDALPLLGPTKSLLPKNRAN